MLTHCALPRLAGSGAKAARRLVSNVSVGMRATRPSRSMGGAPPTPAARSLCPSCVLSVLCVCPFERDPFVCSDRSRGRAVVLLSCGPRVRSAAAASASSPARTCARAQSPQPAEPRPPSLQLEPARPAGGPSAQSPASTAEHAPSPGQPAAGTHPPPVRGSAAAASRYNRARIYGILCVILK